MKFMAAFAFVSCMLVAESLHARIDTATWKKLGGGKDNSVYQDKQHSDRYLTIIETKSPEPFKNMDEAHVKSFLRNIQSQRAFTNTILGYDNWQIKKHQVWNTPQGQKIVLEGSFKDRATEKNFYEIHFYEGSSYRNYQFLESRKPASLGREKAFEVLEKVSQQ